MSTEQGREPVYDPQDLLEELDSVIAAQETLRRRTEALQVRYAALESFADRYDKPGARPNSFPEEYGAINVKFAAKYLDDAARHMEGTATYGLEPARELAEKVREYPQPQRSAEQPEVDRRRSR